MHVQGVPFKQGRRTYIGNRLSGKMIEISFILVNLPLERVLDPKNIKFDFFQKFDLLSSIFHLIREIFS